MSRTVAIVDYGSGNLRSAAKALERVAAEARGEVRVVVTAEAHEVAAAGRIVLPGQGAFADCLAGLSAVPGLREALGESVRRGVPLLGICVGMQLLAERGLEHGVHAGLGWIGGEVRHLGALPGRAPGGRLAYPQMGWNALSLAEPRHRLLDGVAQGDHVYFVHSYALAAADRSDVIATTDYGGPVVAAVAHGTIAGVQFHPEKSQGVGLRILANFLAWSP
ncbi:MAG: imidazole glycerol phosphate synthase subunit HisH [Acetobacteraceae bacterium]